MLFETREGELLGLVCKAVLTPRIYGSVSVDMEWVWNPSSSITASVTLSEQDN